jgi:hypothetical protein
MTRDNRKQPRRPEDHHVCLVGRRKTYGTAKIIDLSASGARLALTGDSHSLPDKFTMVLSYAPKITRECAVVWKRGSALGVTFSS